MISNDDTSKVVFEQVLEENLDVDRYWKYEKFDKKHEKKNKSSYNCWKMAYKILKIDYQAENIANYIYNHSTIFESFSAIMSWLVYMIE